MLADGAAPCHQWLRRGGGWGPLRRAPIQYLDTKGRPGLLRTILEAQETRGLTRSDDISRLLPSEVRGLGCWLGLPAGRGGCCNTLCVCPAVLITLYGDD
jgi:hypothetical protein